MLADHLETFFASLDANPTAKGLPAYIQRAFYDYVPCGILTHGFLRKLSRPALCASCYSILPWSWYTRGAFTEGPATEGTYAS
jgi:hypothetical protein